MREKLTYRSTMAACYLGYVTQAIIVNFMPLLFVTFQKEFAVTLDKLGLLVTVMFVTQLLVDLVVTGLSRWFPFRRTGVAAHVLAVLGLVSLFVLPGVLSDPYVGLLLATVLLSVGGGLIEVLISPITDAIPSQSKVGAMSLLHSFYCWGFLGVVLLSTLFFVTVGTAHWRLLVLLWALVPLVTAGLFAIVPLPEKPEEQTAHHTPLRKLLSGGVFWLLMLLMVCSGAVEQAATQWASLFAESGLRVSKTMGDLLGPCAFAALQGVSRVVFARASEKHDPCRLLLLCSGGCVVSYLLIILSPWPLLSLLGFGLCGIAVGPMWPGTLSLSAARYPTGGTAMFALFALCGDLGCSVAPGLVGAVSNGLQQAGQPLLTSLRAGIGAAGVFALLLVTGLWALRRGQRI